MVLFNVRCSVLSFGIGGDCALIRRWWYMTRRDVRWYFILFIHCLNIIRWLILSGIVGWCICIEASLSNVLAVASTLSITMIMYYVRVRLMASWVIWRESVVGDIIPLFRCKEICMPSMGVELLNDRCDCVSGVSVTGDWISFHRWRNVCWWMMAYTAQSEHVDEVLSLSLVAVQARNSLVFGSGGALEFVVTYRNIS